VAPGTGIPDTATDSAPVQIPATILAVLLVASVGVLTGANVVARRARS
jgi:hypothetical protein